MTIRTKTATVAIAIAGVLFIGGVFYNANTNEVIEEVNLPQLTFQAQDNCNAGQVIKMKVLEGLSFWKEPEFTINDIISEMQFELRINGISDRYAQLSQLRVQAEAWVATFPDCPEGRTTDIISEKVDTLIEKIKAVVTE